MLFTLTPQLLSLPAIFVLEGFNWNPLFNMGFIGCFSTVFQQNMITAFSLVGFLYDYIFVFSQVPEDGMVDHKFIKYDFIHFFDAVLCKALVLAIKYAYYSDEHEEIFCEAIMNDDINMFTSIQTVYNKQSMTAERIF